VFDFPTGGGMVLVELQPGVTLELVRCSTEAHFAS
jgi:acyl CoA:acetate/3-ketoacid CoA transferase beta subunit